MKTVIILALICLFGQVVGIADVLSCTVECKTQEYLPNSSYIFDLFFSKETKLDASIVYSRDLKIFMVVNYLLGISAAFHIDTPYITWANLTSNSILIYDYKRAMALLLSDTTRLQGVQVKQIIDIDRLLQSLSQVVQEKSKFPDGVDVFNVTYMANQFFGQNYNLGNVLKYNTVLANKLESSFGLWFELCRIWIENGYMRPRIGFIGFSGVVYGFYQKSTDAMIILLGTAYSIDAMSTGLVEGIEKIFTNQADAYYVSIRQLIARLKVYPTAQGAINSLFEEVPFEVNKQVKVVKSTKYSFIVHKSADYGYAIIIKNLSHTSGRTFIIYNKLLSIISIHNEILKCTVTVNPQLQRFAVYNYFTNYGLIVDYYNNKARPFSNSLASKYIELSFQFRAAEQINRNLQELSNQTTTTFDFELFLRNLNQSKYIEICRCQSIVPNDVFPDLKTKFGGYLNLIYNNGSFVDIFDSMLPVFGAAGVDLVPCILPLVKKITAGADIHKTADKFLTYVKLNIIKILSNVTINVDSFLQVKFR